MARVTRGEDGRVNESRVTVCYPGIEWVNADIEISCSVAKGDTGEPVSITLSHDEALVLLAKLAERLAMRVDPPPVPERKPVGGGTKLPLK